jgi:hypothetical protein
LPFNTGCDTTPEAQPIAFKATKEKKEESTPSRLPIDASKLDNEAIALIIKSFRQILKQRKGKDYKPCSKWVRDNDKKGKKKMEKKRYYKKKGGEAHMGQNETPTRAPPTPPPTRTLPTSSSTKAFSSPTSATNILWLRIAKRRRYTLDIPQIHYFR